MRKKVVFLPYDLDTALGINNEGLQAFKYSMEDIDHTESGADVYNGQKSVFWKNIRNGCWDRLADMWKTLRSTGALSYQKEDAMFDAHQDVWPEAIRNEDAKVKYIDPLTVSGNASYLPDAQGDKKPQRKNFMFKRYKVVDSQFNAGDALTSVITLRGYAKSDISVKPYIDLYPTIKYGSYLVQRRGQSGQYTVVPCPLDNLDDTEIYVYMADQVASLGDLSGLKLGYVDVSDAVRIQDLKVGDADPNYDNANMVGLDLGNNTLLRWIDARNCSGLTQPPDASGCTNLEHVWFGGTSITGLTLPNGGILKTIEYPATLTNLTILNQKRLTSFTIAGTENLSTLRIENVSDAVDTKELMLGMAATSRVRLIGFDWEMDDVDAVEALFDKLDTMRGLDERGGNVPKAQMLGTITVPELTTDQQRAFAARYPDITVTGEAMSYRVRFFSGDTLLYTETIAEGEDATDPVENEDIETPTKPISGNTGYRYSGWDTDFTNITQDTDVHATYDEVTVWEVGFQDWDGTPLFTAYVGDGNNCPDPVENGDIISPTRPADANYVYTFLGWTGGSLNNVTNNRTLTARYSTVASFTVTFVDWDGTTLATEYCANGGAVSDPIVAGLIPRPTRPENTSSQISYAYTGWNKAFDHITANTTVTAQYSSTNYYYAIYQMDDGTEITRERYNGGTQVTEPVAAGRMAEPTKDSTGLEYNYLYKGWNKSFPFNISANTTIKAIFRTDQQFTLTFVDYDGFTVLDTQTVFDGDSGVEPVSAGRIATPLREPTAQYQYTWTGWNGSYTNVDADRTITATYSSTTRQYTITYYDSDRVTVLYTQKVNYNASGSYTPTKEGYIFRGWSPAVTSVQADISTYASWAASITDTWAQIAAAESNGTYLTKYHVGDMKEVDFGTEGKLIYQIGAFDDHTGSHITWLPVQCALKSYHRWNPSKSSGTSGTGTLGGYGASEIASYLDNDIFALIQDADLKALIKSVEKHYVGYNTSEVKQQDMYSNHKLWLLSSKELGDSSTYSETTGVSYTSIYPDANSRKFIMSGQTSASYWWLRCADSAARARYVINYGSFNSNNVSSAYAVAFGFCT